MGKIDVLQAGLFTSVQDLGRFDMMKYGVPVSGAMDSYAARMANLLVNNTEDSALIEITQMGPSLRFSDPTEIAISGGYLSPSLNGMPLENNRAIGVGKGDVLNFGKRISGFRTYLAVKGGIQTEKVLNSRSWYPGITTYERFEKGMQLPYSSHSTVEVARNAGVRAEEYILSFAIEAFPGPEFERFSEEARKRFEGTEFTIGSQSNRMGIQLDQKFPNSLPSILTGPVLPGTVQLAPSGQLIVLMKDAQTTGGYPRIIQLSEEGMNCLSQKVTGDRIQFRVRSL